MRQTNNSPLKLNPYPIATHMNDLAVIQHIEKTYGFTLEKIELDVDNKILPNCCYVTNDDDRVTFLILNQKINDIKILRNLTSLTKLELRGNKIADLQPLQGLTNLTQLELRGNQITDLQPLQGLTNLTQLKLSHNRITDLLPLQCLTKLTQLELNHNRITDLQPIQGLTNLSQLELTFNQITNLQPLQNLTNLTQLDLSVNEIENLQPIQGLVNLTQLKLRGNKITDLLPLQGLTNLTQLWLTDNQITKIPIWLLNLNSNLEVDVYWQPISNAIGIYVSNNPIIDPPIEIIKQGNQALRNYLQQLEHQGQDYLYEAKLILIGEGSAGKTSLANKIINPTYQLVPEPESISTQGIDILRYQFPYQDKTFHVNIWDFGGQEIYHQTHQFFLTKRSLYFLVADNRKEDTDFYYWLNAVELLTDSSPLWIINNEKKQKSKPIPNQLRDDFDNIKGILPVNLATNAGLKALCEQLNSHIAQLPHIGSPLPKTWIKVREYLETHTNPYISLDDYLTICQQHGFTKTEDKLQLSQYLHDLGVCLHFQDDDLLIKTVILRPTWATEAVYKVLDNETVINNDGRFSKQNLAAIWQDSQYADMHGELLALMLNFKLCYEIPNKKHHYIAPQLLKDNSPDYPWDEQNNLRIRYQYGFMPKGIISQFIVAMHQHIANNYQTVWKSGVVLEQDITQAEVIEHYGRREIYIRIAGKNKKQLLHIVSYELDKINNSYARIKIKKFVPCNCPSCSQNNEPHFFDYEKLKDRVSNHKHEIECDKYPPYYKVNILKLIDDIEIKDKNTDEKKSMIVHGDYIKTREYMKEEYNVEKVKNKKGQIIVGKENVTIKNPTPEPIKEPGNTLKTTLYLTFSFAALVVIGLIFLQSKGMLGNKTLERMVSQIIEKVFNMDEKTKP